MDLKCPNCRKTIHVKQKHIYHAGFSDTGFLYCVLCPTIFLFSSYDDFYQQLFPGKHPWSLTLWERKEVENHLKPCPCGARFRFDAPPRCPHCLGSIASLLPDKIYFLEIDKVIDADKNPDVWI